MKDYVSTKDYASLSTQEPRIKNVYFGKLPSLPPQKPLTPEEIILQKFIAQEKSLVEMVERNNPNHLDGAIAEFEAKIAKKKAELGL